MREKQLVTNAQNQGTCQELNVGI